MNAEEVELLSDSKYRNYVAAVDKALKNFEYSSEWADLISALGKLNKVMICEVYTLLSVQIIQFKGHILIWFVFYSVL